MRIFLLSIFSLLILTCDNSPTATLIEGCIDESACNYDALADEDDGTCTYAEENFDCDGECIAELDCNDECGGSAVLDECGECDGGNYAMDCEGVCDGGSGFDDIPSVYIVDERGTILGEHSGLFNVNSGSETVPARFHEAEPVT